MLAKISRRTCRWLLLCALVPAGLHGQATAGFSTETDIMYAQGDTGPLQADAYIPDGAGPFPGIVFIHGGAWLNGNRSQMVKLIRDLAQRGYVGFTIEYDVTPAHYPVAYDESIAGLKYLRQHAKELHVDPTRIAVAGSSAGGELAALVALDPRAETPVQAAIILNGVLDLTALGDKSSMVTKYLGGVCSSVTAACRDASPQMRVHSGAPPFFVGHGTADETVPFAQAQAFVAALRAASVPVQFFTAQAGPHTYWSKPEFYARNLDEISAFLARALKDRTGKDPK